MSGAGGSGTGGPGRWWLRVWAAVALLDPRRPRRRPDREARARVVRSQRDFLYRKIDDDDPAEDQPVYQDQGPGNA